MELEHAPVFTNPGSKVMYPDLARNEDISRAFSFSEPVMIGISKAPDQANEVWQNLSLNFGV